MEFRHGVRISPGWRSEPEMARLGEGADRGGNADGGCHCERCRASPRGAREPNFFVADAVANGAAGAVCAGRLGGVRDTDAWSR